jgi:ABC-2 type transport system permease protein
VTTSALVRSETTKLFTSRPTWLLGLAAVAGTWPMAWANAASTAGITPDDPRLFSAEPVPVTYQGFEMAGFGYLLVVALAAIWAGSEFRPGHQLRSTLLATPNRLRVFGVKAGLLALTVAGVGFTTMAGTIVITHLSGDTMVHPWILTPGIWARIGGVTIAWTLTALLAFAVGVLARTAIAPLVLITPLVIGLGDVLAELWDGATYLPVAAGAALYSDPATQTLLPPAAGGLVLAAWTLAVLTVAAIAFVRRDLGGRP